MRKYSYKETTKEYKYSYAYSKDHQNWIQYYSTKPSVPESQPDSVRQTMSNRPHKHHTKSPISLSLLFLSPHAIPSPTQIGSMATTNPSPRSVIMHKWRRQDSTIENNSNGILDPNTFVTTMAARGKNI